MSDIHQFEERAAIAEFDGGMSRFDAETLAASEQGHTRWQVMEIVNAYSKRDLPAGGDIGSSALRHTENDMPAMQSVSEEKTGPLSDGDVPTGSGSVALLALPQSGRGVSR